MMTLLMLNLNAHVGKKIPLIAVAAAIVVAAAFGAPAVMEAAGGGAQAVTNGSCDNGYWPVIFGGLFGWFMDLIFGLCR